MPKRLWKSGVGAIILGRVFSLVDRKAAWAMGSTDQQRREVYYAGHVQGVGFRYTTHQIAKGFDVTGFVMNLPDGRVYLVVEAEPAEMSRFLSEIDHRLGEYIRDVKFAELAPTGEFNGFSIRH
ncbi:MAG: acylphosphatase [Planctomycetota bacterium]